MQICNFDSSGNKVANTHLQLCCQWQQSCKFTFATLFKVATKLQLPICNFKQNCKTFATLRLRLESLLQRDCNLRVAALADAVFYNRNGWPSFCSKHYDGISTFTIATTNFLTGRCNVGETFHAVGPRTLRF